MSEDKKEPETLVSPAIDKMAGVAKVKNIKGQFIPLNTAGIPYVNSLISELEEERVSLENKLWAFKRVRKYILKSLPPDAVKKRAYSFRKILSGFNNRVCLFGYMLDKMNILKEGDKFCYQGFVKELISDTFYHQIIVPGTFFRHENYNYYKENTPVYIEGQLKVCKFSLTKEDTFNPEQPRKNIESIPSSYVLVSNIGRLALADASKPPKESV